jgi:hypothetical protein
MKGIRSVSRILIHSITNQYQQAQWASAKEGACAAVEKAKPDLSWLGKGKCEARGRR